LFRTGPADWSGLFVSDSDRNWEQVDNLILIRVAGDLDQGLGQAILRDIKEDRHHRLRMVFEAQGRIRTVLLSLHPLCPWIGRPVTRVTGHKRGRSAFSAACLGVLKDEVLSRVKKIGADRVVELQFATGKVLIAELLPHGANLILLDQDRRILGAARQPRGGQTRLEKGHVLLPRPLPAGRLNPFDESRASLEQYLGGRIAGGEPAWEALAKGLFGLGRTAPGLVEAESRATGRGVAEILLEKLAGLAAGRLDPVIESEMEPLDAASRGELDPKTCRLLPWKPEDGPQQGMRFFERGDAAETATLYYEAFETQHMLSRRASGVLAILDGELRRLDHGRMRAAADLSAFEEPDRYRHWGEALLAGLNHARRVGDGVQLPNPYDHDGNDLVVPVKPGETLQAAAERFFNRYRRAVRGRRLAQGRVRFLEGRLSGLNRIRAEYGDNVDHSRLETLEREMRDSGIPVGLEPQTRAGKAHRLTASPRMEGVRLLTSSEGHSIMVGKSGKDNHRLTFRLAGAEDFWFHVLGRAGAHVILRNPDNRKRPSSVSLREAAAVAAWFSDAQNEELADVQWTRRKYVRRPRGVPAGTVAVKRFETIRVRPCLP
jgi:predicted ribosome quality control (RQC) complex YloA/Tae2 family protein